ncbi:MAG: gliding motility-associated C-terminal domain-containing protein [Flavobacteriales bacterium]|nr:gliding motility-associated C-terminal domain-containing protein [Flavobacteriales bacterium]
MKRSLLDPFFLLTSATLFVSLGSFAQPCNIGYTFTASPLPVGGQYAEGQTVTFCYTLTNWNTTNINWFHGLVPTFGAGWDLSTLVPGTPPPACGGGGGTWGWFPFCDGTSATALPPVGPGFFFDLDNNGIPGDNFGDLCVGPWQFCFTISVASGMNFVFGADLSVSVDTFGDSETGSWGSLGCDGDAVNTITATAGCQAADAGIDGVLSICSDAAPADLFTLLGGSPDAGGTWTEPGGSTVAALLDPSTSASGNYSYTLLPSGACPGDVSIVAVVISTPVNAGQDVLINICDASPVTNLFTLIAGATIGGTWSSPGGGVFSGNYDPALNVSGIYIYSLPAAGACPADQSMVTVNEIATPNAGADGAVALCSSSAPEDLFALIVGAQPGGTWTAPGGAINNGTVQPSGDPSGIYVYTINAIAPCLTDQSQVTVTINQAANAGADSPTTLCDLSPPTDLFPFLIGADPGGTWTAPGGGAFSGTYDPSANAPGAFTYTVTATAPCIADQAIVSVNENSTPDAGIDGTVTLCNTSNTIDLLTLLVGGQSGGTWTAPSGVASSGSVDPAVDQAGTYVYTIAAIAPCSGDAATVDVLINPAVNAGNDAVVNLCDQSPATALYPSLGAADVGGTWTAPGGVLFSGTYDPVLNSSGIFTYTVLGAAPCANDQANVTVNETSAPFAGADGAIALCSTNAITDLFPSLAGAQSGGTWTAPDGSSSSGSIDPSTALSGTFTYTLADIPPCAGDDAVVAVTINSPPPSGVDAATSACETGPTLNLFTLFNGQLPVGGTWTDPNGNPTSDQFDPDQDQAGTYTYTLPASAPCVVGLNTVTLAVDDAPFAGGDGFLSLCSSGANNDLFDALEGSPDVGGNWTDPLNASVNAVVDPSFAQGGSYTYTVPANGLCPGDDASVSLSITTASNAGSNGAASLCEDDDPLDLFSVLAGTPQAGGSWTLPGGGASTAVVDPSTAQSGNYTYTVNGNAPCPNVSASVTIDIDVLPFAGTDASIALCAEADPQLLLLILTGADIGGSWTAPDGTGSSGQFDPANSVEGEYAYTVIGNGACSNVSSTATVVTSVLPSPSALFSEDTLIGCEPLTVQFVVQDPTVLQANWNFGDGLSSNAGPTTLHNYTFAGSFTPVVQVTDNNGCTATASSTNSVSVLPLPSAFFATSPAVASVADPHVLLVPACNTCTSFLWVIDGEESGNSSPLHYTFPSEVGGEYEVCLQVSDIGGCAASFCSTVLVRDELAIHVPNAFTPDGNGVNDSFLPFVNGADAENYAWYVFDRGGAIVFQSSTIGEAWTGGLNNSDEPLPQGVYVWRIVVREGYSSDRKEVFGHVTLVR